MCGPPSGEGMKYRANYPTDKGARGMDRSGIGGPHGNVRPKLYDSEKGTFTISVPILVQYGQKIFSFTWPALKWLFWPIIGVVGLAKAMSEYPRKTKRAFAYVGVWVGGIWAGFMTIGFFICLIGPDDLTPHFNWFCFVTGYLGIALSLMSGKYIHDTW